jgi:hypothetical protein
VVADSAIAAVAAVMARAAAADVGASLAGSFFSSANFLIL